MSGEQLGQNFQVFVGDGDSPEQFAVVAGQKGLQRQASTAMIDIASKSSGSYGLQAVGRSQMTITVTGQRVLPDANGLERVHALSISRAPANFQVCDTSVSPDEVVLQGSMYVGNFSQGDDDQSGSSYSFTLTLADVPSVDDLSPSTSP